MFNYVTYHLAEAFSVIFCKWLIWVQFSFWFLHYSNGSKCEFRIWHQWNQPPQAWHNTLFQPTWTPVDEKKTKTFKGLSIHNVISFLPTFLTPPYPKSLYTLLRSRSKKGVYISDSCFKTFLKITWKPIAPIVSFS